MVTSDELAHARERFIWISEWIGRNTYPRRKPPLCRKKMDQAIRIRMKARARYRTVLVQWAKEKRDSNTPMLDSEQIRQLAATRGTRYHDSVARHEGLE
jgi:hypothetical protein